MNDDPPSLFININDDCLNHILHYLSLHEKVKLIMDITNKRLHKHLICQYKTIIIKNPIYDKILSHHNDNRNIFHKSVILYPIIFFELQFFRHNFRDFKKFIFHYANKITHSCFIIVSRLQKVYYVFKITKNCCVLLFYNINDIYYQLFYNKIPFNNDEMICNSPSGYLYYNNKLIEKHQDVLEKINDIQENNQMYSRK